MGVVVVVLVGKHSYWVLFVKRGRNTRFLSDFYQRPKFCQSPWKYDIKGEIYRCLETHGRNQNRHKTQKKPGLRKHLEKKKRAIRTPGMDMCRHGPEDTGDMDI